MKKNISVIVTGLIFLSAILNSCKQQAEENPGREDDRPNIVMFFTDDNDFSYWGFGGGPDLSPNIDQIINEGVQATQFYCTAAVSTPSRYSLHTGRFAGRCLDRQFMKSFPEDQPYNIIRNTFLDAEKEFTLGEMLQNAGYTTGFVGKWHLGFDRSEYKLEHDADISNPEVDKVLKAYQSALVGHVKNAGFDYAASIVPGNIDDNFIDALHYHNLEWYAKGGQDFIEMNKNSEKPFFLIVNITTHHSPCHIESINSDIRITQAGLVDGLDKVMPPRSSISERIMEKGYPLNFKTAGTVWTDDCVGSILNKLDDNNFTYNTAVIFTTDHNRYDGKATCYQGGVHIPFGMKWPGIIKPGTKTNKKIAMQDLMPTIAEMTEASIPDEVLLDGISKLEFLRKSKNLRNDDEVLYFEFGYSRAVLAGKYKYIAFRLPEELLENMKTGVVNESYNLHGTTSDEPGVMRYPYYFDADQLYDIEADPEEQHNLAYEDEYSGILKQMQETLKNYTGSFRNPFPVEDPDPFYLSPEYQKLNEKARDINMNQYYWYRKGCY